MHRKLYALLILIGTIGALVLFYLYFFVFYTSQLTFNSNVGDYKVSFFSTSLAQKREENCPEAICIIKDVSPFKYNITILKDGYETKTLNTEIVARTNQEFIIELEKKAILEEVLDMKALETPQEKISRLRADNLSYARFTLSKSQEIRFSETTTNLQLTYIDGENSRDIQSFPKVPQDEIEVSSIGESGNIFIRLGKISYIFETKGARLYTLPFEIKVNYIKPGSISASYLVVTENGTFHYSTLNNKSEYEYLFKDFVYNEAQTIGVIYKDEIQKKNNFGLQQKGNLIINYNPQTKDRKVIFVTEMNIERIEKIGEKIIFTAGKKQYELKNFD